MNSPDTTYTTYEVLMGGEETKQENSFEEVLLPETEKPIGTLGSDMKAEDEVEIQACGRPDKNDWLDAPTKMLLTLMKNLLPRVGTTYELKTKRKMWSVISDKLCEAGYTYTWQQIESKYYSLERRYKKSLNGNDKYWPYESDVAELMGDKRNMPTDPCNGDENSICSEIAENSVNVPIASNHDKQVSSNEINIEILPPNADSESNFIAHNTDAPLADSNVTLNALGINRNLKRKIDTLSKKCNELISSNKEFEERILHYLELREEREKRKEERAEREEERKRKKLELFEKLVEKLTA